MSDSDYSRIFTTAAPVEPYAIDIPDSALVEMIEHPFASGSFAHLELRKIASTVRLMNLAFWDELCARFDADTALQIFDAARNRVEASRPQRATSAPPDPRPCKSLMQ